MVARAYGRDIILVGYHDDKLRTLRGHRLDPARLDAEKACGGGIGGNVGQHDSLTVSCVGGG